MLNKKINLHCNAEHTSVDKTTLRAKARISPPGSGEGSRHEGRGEAGGNIYSEMNLSGIYLSNFPIRTSEYFETHPN